MELHERVNAIKLKVLDVIESRVNDNATMEELQQITYALNNIDKDENYFSKTLGLISGSGFNGKSNEIPAKTENAE